jgi:hypothetical protein
MSAVTGIPPTGGAAAMSRYSLANGNEIEARKRAERHGHSISRARRSTNRGGMRCAGPPYACWMPFKYGPDGSLDLYFQNQNPGADKEANWLPAPKGPFNLTMRLYAPKDDALTGKWNPPPVTKAAAR